MARNWRVERSQGHWHVRISKDEVLDVDSEPTARLIAGAPDMHAALLAESLGLKIWKGMARRALSKVDKRK